MRRDRKGLSAYSQWLTNGQPIETEDVSWSIGLKYESEEQAEAAHEKLQEVVKHGSLKQVNVSSALFQNPETGDFMLVIITEAAAYTKEAGARVMAARGGEPTAVDQEIVLAINARRNTALEERRQKEGVGEDGALYSRETYDFPAELNPDGTITPYVEDEDDKRG